MISDGGGRLLISPSLQPQTTTPSWPRDDGNHHDGDDDNHHDGDENHHHNDHVHDELDLDKDGGGSIIVDSRNAFMGIWSSN